MTEAPNVHPILAEADRRADYERAQVIGTELARMQARINELEAENVRLRAQIKK